MKDEIAKKYEIRVNEICKKWINNEKVNNLIRQWYSNLLNAYDITNDFINHNSLEEYADNYLTALEKLNIINIYSLEEVIRLANNNFYADIIKIPDNIEIAPKKE